MLILILILILIFSHLHLVIVNRDNELGTRRASTRKPVRGSSGELRHGLRLLRQCRRRRRNPRRRTWNGGPHGLQNHAFELHLHLRRCNCQAAEGVHRDRRFEGARLEHSDQRIHATKAGLGRGTSGHGTQDDMHRVTLEVPRHVQHCLWYLLQHTAIPKLDV